MDFLKDILIKSITRFCFKSLLPFHLPFFQKNGGSRWGGTTTRVARAILLSDVYRRQTLGVGGGVEVLQRLISARMVFSKSSGIIHMILGHCNKVGTILHDAKNGSSIFFFKSIHNFVYIGEIRINFCGKSRYCSDLARASKDGWTHHHTF